jgi:hypothetical protein
VFFFPLKNICWKQPFQEEDYMNKEVAKLHINCLEVMYQVKSGQGNQQTILTQSQTGKYWRKSATCMELRSINKQQ